MTSTMQLKTDHQVPNNVTELSCLGQGFYWQDISIDQEFRTFRRTITETDLVNFINATGMVEAIFIDKDFSSHFGVITGRVVPAALTYCLIEGLLFQSMIQGTGLAMLELVKKAVAPTFVGDSVWAIVKVTDIKPTSKNNRAIVTSLINIFNQNNVLVVTYTAVRMLAGR